VRQLTPGTVVDDRYTIVTRLGSGGMADVYCAEDQQLGRRVALKVLYDRFAEDSEFVERFRREASHAAGLNHQHIVAVYDRGEWEGTSYIAMEFVDGQTLKQVIQAEAPMDPVRAIDLITQVLRAARFAHRRGVIHRDLKPHNVIVDEEQRAKVTDFGIARAGASDMTQTGSIMGTAQYLSPEQAQGHAVTPQSDLYSIGICLYEMLTGRIPFEGDSAVAIALKQVNEAPVPPSHYNRAIPAPLEDAVLRALAKDPGERFPDADAFIAALDDAKAQIVAGNAPPAQPTAAFAPVAMPGTPPVPVEDIVYPVAAAPVAVVEDDGPKWPWLLLISALVVGAIVAALLLTGTIGSKKVRVPGVVGITQEGAATVLHRDNLNVRFTPTPNRLPAGRTIGQIPSPGTQVKEGTTVQVTVSSGPGNGQIPVVDGLTRHAARKALTKAGFKIREHSEYSTGDPTVAKGHVTRTQPQGGTANVPIGSVVDLYVSLGPPNVDIPDVTNQQLSDARATLTAAGFKVATSDKESTTEDPGTVLAESPGSGQAPKGSTVTLTVAKAPASVDVPDETGKLADHASIDLQRAGFIVVTQTVDTGEPDQNGRVVDQSPAGGAKAKPKSTVTISVEQSQTPTTTTPPTTTTAAP
jgi:beta-lactam-binding protein with PASTA domain/predicted Ser/Thr protein kinase